MGYPLPCGFCNMMAQDENIDGDCFEEQGWVKDGKMVIHFPDCPARPGAYPRVLARKETALALEQSKAALDIAVQSIELQAKPRGPFELLGKVISDLLGI